MTKRANVNLQKDFRSPSRWTIALRKVKFELERRATLMLEMLEWIALSEAIGFAFWVEWIFAYN